MTIRHMRNSVAAGLLLWGVAAVSPAGAQTALPEQGGMITLVGCFQRGGPQDKYVLTNPQIGAVTSVTDGRCADPYDQHAVELKDLDKVKGKSPILIGQVVEISGRLEKLEGHMKDQLTGEDVRELHVRSFKLVPVVPPKAPEMSMAQPFIESRPEPKVEVREEPAVATSGTEKAPLPKTASPLPTIGFLGILALAGAFMLRLFNPARIGGRG